MPTDRAIDYYILVPDELLHIAKDPRFNTSVQVFVPKPGKVPGSGPRLNGYVAQTWIAGSVEGSTGCGDPLECYSEECARLACALGCATDIAAEVDAAVLHWKASSGLTPPVVTTTYLQGLLDLVGGRR